jgi:hypothetical protein
MKAIALMLLFILTTLSSPHETNYESQAAKYLVDSLLSVENIFNDSPHDRNPSAYSTLYGMPQVCGISTLPSDFDVFRENYYLQEEKLSKEFYKKTEANNEYRTVSPLTLPNKVKPLSFKEFVQKKHEDAYYMIAYKAVSANQHYLVEVHLVHSVPDTDTPYETSIFHILMDDQKQLIGWDTSFSAFMNFPGWKQAAKRGPHPLPPCP